jgi:hypothetical protein
VQDVIAVLHSVAGLWAFVCRTNKIPIPVTVSSPIMKSKNTTPKVPTFILLEILVV